MFSHQGQNARAGVIYITLHNITLHYIIYRYGFTLVFCNLHCIHYHGKLQLALYIYIYTTTQCKLLERKYGICASGWKEKHHQRKLQWVKPPRVQVEYLCQLLREKRHHRKLVLVTTTVRTRCKGRGAGGVHNAAIIATCVRVHNSNFFHALS